MPTPITISFAATGEEELNRVFASVKKRVDELAKAESRAAKESVRAAKDKSRIVGDLHRSPHGAANNNGGYRNPGAVWRDEAKAAEKFVKEQIAWQTRLDKIKLRSATMAGQLAAKQARAESMANARRTSAITGAVGRAGRSTYGTVAGVAGGLGATLGTAMIGSALMENIALRSRAVALVNSTRDKGGKETTSVAGLVSESQGLAGKYGIDAGEILSGKNVIAERAGGAAGLSAIKDDWAELAKTAAAYGVNMEDMGGVVAAALNSNVRPGQELLTLIEDLVAMGKEGSIEFRQMADVLPQIAGAGKMTELSGADMVRRSAQFTQIAVRQKVTPEQARTSYVDMMSELSRKSGALKKSGINVFNAAGTKQRDTADVMAEIINAAFTGGINTSKGKLKGADALADLFTGSSLPIANELADVYGKSGGGEKGKSAVTSILKDTAHLAPGERDASLALVMADEGTKLKQNMQMFYSEMAKLLPEFVKLMPALSEATKGLAQLTVMAAKNPFPAIGALFTAHLLQAGIGAAVSSALSGLISKSGIGAAASGANVSLVALAAAAGLATGALIGKALDESGVGTGSKAYKAGEFARQMLDTAKTRALTDKEKSMLAQSQGVLSDYSQGGATTWKQMAALGPAGAVAANWLQNTAAEDQGLTREQAGSIVQELNAKLGSAADKLDQAASKMLNAPASNGSPATRSGVRQ